jgi:hypothetical protein
MSTSKETWKTNPNLQNYYALNKSGVVYAIPDNNFRNQ